MIDYYLTNGQISRITGISKRQVSKARKHRGTSRQEIIKKLHTYSLENGKEIARLVQQNYHRDNQQIARDKIWRSIKLIQELEPVVKEAQKHFDFLLVAKDHDLAALRDADKELKSLEEELRTLYSKRSAAIAQAKQFGVIFFLTKNSGKRETDFRSRCRSRKAAINYLDEELRQEVEIVKETI